MDYKLLHLDAELELKYENLQRKIEVEKETIKETAKKLDL